MSLLHFHKITKEYSNRTVLNDVSLSIEKNECLALIGKNGTGKTTLLRIAMGLESPDTGRVIRARGMKIGYLSQNSDALTHGSENALFLQDHKALEDKLKHMENRMADPMALENPEAYDALLRDYDRALHAYEAMDGYVIESKIKKTLLGLGLSSDALYRPLDSLSGGERIRVALARILIQSPDLLILDEPTNHLDLSGIEWLEDYLRRFTGGVLLVSHDRYFLDRVTTRTAELENGHILTKSCNYSSFMAQKEIQRAFYLKEGKNLQIRLRDKKAQVQKLIGNSKIRQAKSRMHDVEKLQAEIRAHKSELKSSAHLTASSGPNLNFKSHGHISKDIAWGKNISKSFGARGLFENISFNIYGGDRIGIIGPNGCGKSTLLKLLMGQDQDYSGELVLGSWLNYCYLGQSVDFPDESASILDHICRVGPLDIDSAKRHLSDFQFYAEHVETALSRLSGGERVRVYLAEVMLKAPHLLILDEPTNHLDLASRQAIERAVNRFRGTVIAVSHDRYYLNTCVHRIFAFEGKSLQIFEGNYDAYKSASMAAASSVDVNSHDASAVSTQAHTGPVRDKSSQVGSDAPILSAIEEEIYTTESRIDALQAKIQALKSTDPAHYVELDALHETLDELYAAYDQYA